MMALYPEDQRTRVKHIAYKFIESPETNDKILKEENIPITHVFFYAHFQPKPPPGKAARFNAEEVVRVNGDMFENQPLFTGGNPPFSDSPADKSQELRITTLVVPEHQSSNRIHNPLRSRWVNYPNGFF
jgi:hypothetical protein